ncbi:MAG: hypothetical protein R3E58_01080 [Phycisphaerae bacterium]|nr:hypothetical protein [Phycisphaerales bacterium]
MNGHKFVIGVVLASTSLLGGKCFAGIIDLEFRPSLQVVAPGETVNVGLYAVSVDETDDVISVMDVVLTWDPAILSLQGVVNNGPYNWLSSGFPFNAIGGLNVDLTDGDATYTARSRFAPQPSAMATSNGLLVTTIQFVAVAESSTTTLSIVESIGIATTKVVGDIPGFDVHGQLNGATFVVQSCTDSDPDDDGDVDLVDFAAFQQCFGVSSIDQFAIDCLCSFDSDNDGDIDLTDFDSFAAGITGP